MKTFGEYQLEVDAIFAQCLTYEEAFARLGDLVSDNNPVAIFNLGLLYESGDGVAQNNTTALAHYITADQLGLLAAKYRLGVITEFGQCGVGQSFEVAAGIYQEAADLGHSEAQCQLGGLFERGLGVEKNDALAFRYYQLASDGGLLRAKFLVADCFLNGKGVAQSVTEALKLFHQAAEAGHGFSQLVLGNLYRHGHELPLNYVMAYHYANLACLSATNESDKSAAIGLRDEIYNLMSDEEKVQILSILNESK